MKQGLLFILLMFVTMQNLKANQIVDITTVEELKLAYGKDLNVYVSGHSDFYFMGNLTKSNLLQACTDNGYICSEQNGIIELNKVGLTQNTILPSEIKLEMPAKKFAKSVRNKPESFLDLPDISVAAGKLIYKENDQLDSNLTTAEFVKPVVYLYSRTNNERDTSFVDELLTSLAPFSLSNRLGLSMNFLFTNKNVADFFNTRTSSFYFSNTFISCVTGNYCEVMNESRYEYDETVRTQISESTSKRFDTVTQGFKLRFREEAVDLSVSFCDDRYNCLKFEQVAERKKGECYELFYKTDIKINSRVIFGSSKTKKITNLGFLICEK